MTLVDTVNELIREYNESKQEPETYILKCLQCGAEIVQYADEVQRLVCDACSPFDSALKGKAENG